MNKLILIFLFIFCNLKIFALDSTEAVSVSVGSPQYEYSTEVLPHTFVTVEATAQQKGSQIFSEFHNLQTYKSNHKLFRVRLPLKIIPKRSIISDTISILYTFRYKYELYKLTKEGKEHIEEILSFPTQIEKIPIKNSGITTWTLTSDWMVKSDREFWDPYKGGFVMHNNGKTEFVKEAKKFYANFEPVSKFYFPFDVSYWSKSFLEDRWPETKFPNFFIRKVEGNETYVGCSFQIFTGGLSEPSIGNVSLPQLHSFVKEITNNWKESYSQNSVYSNCWEKKDWALKFRKIAGIKLQAAFLARICLTDSKDSDAADLLLKNLVAQKESGKARSIYLRCVRSWPDFSEYWFKQYFKSIEDDISKKVAVMAFKRDHPDSNFAIGTLVDLLLKSERWSSAKTLQKSWEEKDPSNIFAYVAAIKLAKTENNPEKEKKALCKIIQLSIDKSKLKLSPHKGTKYYELYLTALNFRKSKNYNAALLTLRKALEISTNFAAVYVTLGEIYTDIKVYGSAKKQFEIALAINPENPAALAGLIRITKKADKYEKKLWAVLKPEIIKQKNSGNWTNALNLARFEFELLSNVNKLYIDVAVSYIESLIELKQYEKASKLLYNISNKQPDNPNLNYLWGEFASKINKDPHFLLLESSPFEWQKKAVDAFKKVIKNAHRSKKAYAQLAILYVENEKLSKAYNVLKKWFRLEPSTELALWIADICLLKSFENFKEVVPGESSLTFLEVANSFYKKADLEESSPAAKLGLIRCNQIIKNKTKNSSFIRQSLKLFPESPELRAEKIKLLVEAETTAPILWMPYTNILKKLRPYHYEISTILKDLFQQRKLKSNQYNYLINIAFLILKWDAIYFSDISDRLEFQQSPEIYSLEKNIGFRFVLKKQLFVNPIKAYPWFAIRSKYTKNDLRLGKTKWWKRHLFIKSAYSYLKKAAEINDSAKKYISLIVNQFDDSFLIGEDRKLRAYGPLLRSCFYVDWPECKKRPKSLKKIYSRKNLKDFGITDNYNSFLKESFVPLIFRSRWALPPQLRQSYLPPFALQKIFQKDYKNRFSPVWNYFSLKNYRGTFVEFSSKSTNIFWWTENISTLPIMDYSISKNKVSVHQRQSGSEVTSSWKGVGGVPLTKNRDFPLLESFINTTASGTIENIKIAGAKIDKKFPPEFSLIFSPAPLDCPVENWYDEALVLQLSWLNHTNQVLKVFAKIYNEENGTKPESPGIKLGEFSSLNLTNIYWVLSKENIKIYSQKNKKKVLDFNHLLSPFAWTHGFYINVQFKGCENPVSYFFNKIVANSD